MAYQVYCRECDWEAPNPIELKGEANVVAGKHISETGHSVALEEAPEEAADREFNRGGSPGGVVEIFRGPAEDGDGEGELRHCGPVVCRVQRAKTG